MRKYLSECVQLNKSFSKISTQPLTAHVFDYNHSNNFLYLIILKYICVPPLLLSSLPRFQRFVSDSTGHPAVFIGDVKLAELKMFLTRAGFYTELTGGLLVCNRVVSIRKVYCQFIYIYYLNIKK